MNRIPDLNPRWGRRPMIACLVGLWTVVVPAIGPQAAAQESEAPSERVVAPPDLTQAGPPPLLREGGILVDVPGTIVRDERLRVHVFRPSSERTGGVIRELVLLPSRGLEDLSRIAELRARAEDEPFRGIFEVTGRVLVYRGRNFLLPESVVPVDPAAASPVVEPVAEVPESGDPEDRIADDIEARLEARIGAVPRSLDLADAAPIEKPPIRSGTRFVDRRGRLARDPETGVWRFVAAGGRGDATIVLLPCLELERIERTTRQRDISRPLLVSGLVTAYRGRNYLLPSAVAVAEEGRGIGP